MITKRSLRGLGLCKLKDILEHSEPLRHMFDPVFISGEAWAPDSCLISVKAVVPWFVYKIRGQAQNWHDVLVHVHKQIKRTTIGFYYTPFSLCVGETEGDGELSPRQGASPHRTAAHWMIFFLSSPQHFILNSKDRIKRNAHRTSEYFSLNLHRRYGRTLCHSLCRGLMSTST